MGEAISERLKAEKSTKHTLGAGIAKHRQNWEDELQGNAPHRLGWKDRSIPIGIELASLTGLARSPSQKRRYLLRASIPNI